VITWITLNWPQRTHDTGGDSLFPLVAHWTGRRWGEVATSRQVKGSRSLLRVAAIKLW
jgi:hypothetical protein